MKKWRYSSEEQKINNVLNYQKKQLEEIHHIDMKQTEECIKESEDLLLSLGYGLPTKSRNKMVKKCKTIVVPEWDQLCKEAEKSVGSNTTLDMLFTKEEIENNHVAIKLMQQEFDSLYHLDQTDIMISAFSGLLTATVDILLIGIPKKTHSGIKAGFLSDYIRTYFYRKYPEEELKKLADQGISKVPYDAQDNRNTVENVKGLSSYYHRLLSLGHDPLLGFIFGVKDILNGTMTTIDKEGKYVSQVMENYADRKEQNVFDAIAKQIIHLKTDLTTSMGLPVPGMALFNKLQIGSIGVEEQTVAKIVQGMYYEGYDFIHFCSMPLSVMLIEASVRMGYAFKSLNEGYTIKESIPFSRKPEKKAKLQTMLFIAHTVATAINAGKITFSKNPLAINYVQWFVFIRYTWKQLNWVFIKKPMMKEHYINNMIFYDLQNVYEDIDDLMKEYDENSIFVFE